MWSDLTYRIRALFQRKRVDRELEEELRSHFEHEVEKRVQQGQPRESAVREARLAFGGMEQVKEECRDARGISLIETNFFSVLGVAPQYGRYFLPGEDAAGAPVVVLSDHYRRSRFAADPSIVGQTVNINQTPFTVIGVTRPEFSGITVGIAPDIWVPLHALDRIKLSPKLGQSRSPAGS